MSVSLGVSKEPVTLRYPKNPTVRYATPTMNIEMLRTPKNPPKSCGERILFSSGRIWWKRAVSRHVLTV